MILETIKENGLARERQAVALIGRGG